MTNKTYSGWTNRETWLVHLWYGDVGIDIDQVREILEEMVENLGNGILQDMLDLDCVNWNELRESWEDTDEED